MPAAEITTSRVTARPVVPTRGQRRGAGLGEVHLAQSGFWGQLQAVNATGTLEHCLAWIERLGWLANFDHVATGQTGGERPGWQFSDSEIYKLMEALAWEHGRTGDPHAAEVLERLTDRIGAAQDADGYLNTCFGHAGQPPRYSDLEMGHELYCTGHLLQAAVARMRTHGRDRLVEIAQRAADHVCREFGSDGREAICGHPEIELGLVELGRALNEPRYVEQARIFIERRGRGLLGRIPLLGPSYFQDDVAVREADAWRGHAVRALYLSAAAVDVAVDLEDRDLLGAIERQWERSVERRTYITGGMGSRHQDEGFGDDWELPPDRAYCETCAGIGSAMVSWRLYLATGDLRYVDLMERTFFNVVATSPDEAGTAFFYANPLQQRVAGTDVLPGVENPRAEGGTRAPWFDVSCCPTNLARTLANWNTYTVAVDGDTVDLLQFADGEVHVELDSGGTLALRVSTAYPLDGLVHIQVLEAPNRPVTLRLRVPHWATEATLDSGLGPQQVAPGWAVVTAILRLGDSISLALPMSPRLTWPDPRIDAVRGCVAVERGPIVLCLESVDLPDGASIDDVRVLPSRGVRSDGTGACLDAVLVSSDFPESSSPGLASTYRSEPSQVISAEPLEISLVPYHQWAQRGPSTMRIFLPTIEEAA